MIIEKKKENVCRFKGVEQGEVFKYNEEYFMKINSETIIDEYDGRECKVNAVSLRNGWLELFLPDEEVELLVCKLVIEQKKGEEKK